MSVKLTCPVCEAEYSRAQSEIEANICPNCETDLSTYGILANLSICSPMEAEKKSKSIIPIWLPCGIAILFLLLGLGLGFASNSVIAKQQEAVETSTNIADSISVSPTKPDRLIAPILADVSPEIVEPQSKNCGGFNYTVRPGDSLSLIAAYFYGNSSYWSLISDANPKIKRRENLLEIDELLLIPNLNNACLNR